MFAARSHSAVIFFSRRPGAALLNRASHGQRRHSGQDVGARDLAVVAAHRTRNLLAIDAQPTNVFYLRGHADADRPRLSVPVPTGSPRAALAMDRAGGHSGWLLAGVGALSGS